MIFRKNFYLNLKQEIYMEMNITAWKGYANSRLSPAERIKDEIKPNIELLKTKYPSWAKNNDARWAWFTGSKKILQTYQLGCLFIRDQLTEKEWWQEKVHEYNENEICSSIKEYNVFLNYGFSNTLFTITEELFRLLVRSIDENACKKGACNFKNICEYLLKYIEKQQYTQLFYFHSLIRNTIHTNAVYYPKNQLNESVEFLGKTYNFEVGEKLHFVKFELLCSLTSEYNKAIIDIVTSSSISVIPYVERFR